MKIWNWVSKIFEKKSLVMAFVFLCAVWISTPTATSAQYTKSPAELQRYNPSTFEECQNRGRIPDGVTQKDIANCVDGEYAILLNTIGAMVTNVTFAEVLGASSEDTLAAAVSRLNDSREANGGGGLDIALDTATDRILGQRPASGVMFTQEVVANVFSADKVYADDVQAYFPGWGFDLLSPVRTLWGYFVGLAYSFMIFLVLVIAFALMFRANIGGEQAVQLQNAIPGIVLAMILIPLSYPISGLFIDGITLGTNITRNFLIGTGGVFEDVYLADDNGLKYANPDFLGSEQDTSTEGSNTTEDNRGLFPDDPRLGIFQVQNILGIGQGGGVRPIQSATCAIVYGSADAPECTPGFGTDAASIGLTKSVGQFLGDVLSFIVAAFVFTIVKIIFLATSFRIGWKLFLQFINLLLLPAFSPIIFATLALPGQGNKIVVWYLKRLGNVTVNFVAAYGLILLSIIFSAASFTNLIPTFTNADGEQELRQFEPPLLSGTVGFGQLTGAVNGASGNTNQVVNVAAPSIFYFVGLGLFVMIPGILQQITDQLAPRQENPFVKFATEEIGKTRDLAFRQAPAALGAPIRGARDGFTRARTFTKNRKKNALDKSSADREIERAQGRYADRQKKINAAENGNWFQKNIEARARKGINSVQTAIDRANASTYGRADDLKPKEGDEGAQISIGFRFNNSAFLPQNPDDVGAATRFRAPESAVAGKTVTGQLVVSVPKGSGAPQGPVAIAIVGSSLQIAKADGVSIEVTEKPAKEEKEFIITTKSIPFGDDNIGIDIKLVANASVKSGFTIQKPVKVAIGNIKTANSLVFELTK